MRILGLMTGNSCDALDAACLEFRETPTSARASSWQLLWTAQEAYPKSLAKRVLAAQQPSFVAASRGWLTLDRDLGVWYAKTVEKILTRVPRKKRPHVVANHGQTLAHFPGEKGGGLSWQLGGTSWLTARTGLTSLTQFRQGDLAGGGQGAPLIPLFQEAWIKKHRVQTPVSLLNLGGVSNFTYLPRVGPLIAGDAGPCNLWIDEAVERATRGRTRIDYGGRLTALGRSDEKAVIAVLRHPYFRLRGPRSTGRDQFPLEYLIERTRARGADLVATAARIAAESIAHAYERDIFVRRLPLQTIYCSGGGSHNKALCSMIEGALNQKTSQPVSVRSLSEVGEDPQTIEAQAFAYLGWRSLQGLALGGAWTGAKPESPPALILPGRNWETVLNLLSRTRTR